MWDLLSCSNDSLKFIAATLSLPRLARTLPFCAAATPQSRWKTEKKECVVHTQRPLIPLNENDSIEIGHKGSERGELASHLAHCRSPWMYGSPSPSLKFASGVGRASRMAEGSDVVGKHH